MPTPQKIDGYVTYGEREDIPQTTCKAALCFASAIFACELPLENGHTLHQESGQLNHGESYLISWDERSVKIMPLVVVAEADI